MQGSGKTLAFGLPILQLILEESCSVREVVAEGADPDEAFISAEGEEAQQGAASEQVNGQGSDDKRLKALILAPTRCHMPMVCTSCQLDHLPAAHVFAHIRAHTLHL